LRLGQREQVGLRRVVAGVTRAYQGPDLGVSRQAIVSAPRGRPLETIQGRVPSQLGGLVSSLNRLIDRS
jgi:hypothetical protein